MLNPYELNCDGVLALPRREKEKLIERKVVILKQCKLWLLGNIYSSILSWSVDTTRELVKGDSSDGIKK